MIFENPFAFILLFFIPLVFLLRKSGIFSKISCLSVLCDWNKKSFELENRCAKVISVFASILAYLGFIFAVIAFSDPVKTVQEKIFTEIGSDIVFVIDTSPSMAALDMNGKSRLEITKQTIQNSVIQNEGVRFSLVVFGSVASILVPPGFDNSFFFEKLSNVKIGEMGNGSAIGSGISTAVFHLAGSSAQKKCMILFTDGENNAGEIAVETASLLSKENGISLYVVGVGTKGNVPIEYVDPQSKKNYSGYFDSNYDSEVLAQIARTGGGIFFEAASTLELQNAIKNISETEVIKQNFTYKTIQKSLWQYFIFISFVLFAISWFIKRILSGEIL